MTFGAFDRVRAALIRKFYDRLAMRAFAETRSFDKLNTVDKKLKFGLYGKPNF